MRFATNLSFVPGVVSTLTGTLMIHACQVENLFILATVAQLDVHMRYSRSARCVSGEPNFLTSLLQKCTQNLGDNQG